MQRQLDRESKDRAAALERAATAQQLLSDARSHTRALEKEVSMLQADLADAKADARKRLEQLGAKVSDIEVAKNEQNELSAQLTETQREYEGSQRQVRLSWSPSGNAGV
jgi:chromosome segregation ATPase